MHPSVPELIAILLSYSNKFDHLSCSSFTFGPADAQFVSQTSIKFCFATGPIFNSPNSILFIFYLL
uniref:Glutamine--scyllo-inositol transaminase n=1 Tax=uncultured marine virus TaxID=186617 RepID=A0A0F7L831_9VIRU|nr:glutamine--scyllo-inositol transaminase [uncultured marine virus]